MINRVVRMEFELTKVSIFIEVFNESKQHIAHFPGCKSLRLCKDPIHDNVYYTLSVWEKEEDLENYRYSELFKKIWAATKILFSAKPQAFSLKDWDIVR